jgi:hypothetical protein
LRGKTFIGSITAEQFHNFQNSKTNRLTMVNYSLKRRPWVLLQAVVLILISLGNSPAEAASLSNGEREEQELTEDIECTYFQGSLRYNMTDRNRMVHLCRITSTAAVSGNFELPSIFDFDDDELESGSTKLSLTDLQPNPTTGIFEIMGPHPSFSIIQEAQYFEASEELLAASATSRTIGSRNVMVVRVTSADAGSPSHDRQELSRNIFGDPTNIYRPSFATQYNQCSQGQLKFHPATYAGSDESGVHDLNLPYQLLDREFDFQIDQWLETAFIQKFGPTE